MTSERFWYDGTAVAAAYSKHVTASKVVLARP